MRKMSSGETLRAFGAGGEKRPPDNQPAHLPTDRERR
jgi:hypothetical protein